MAKVRVLENRTGNAFYVPRGYQIGDNLALTTWGSAAKYKIDEALQVSAHLRGQGLDATCIADSGGQSLEPRVEVAPAESQSYSWRGIVPKRITATMWGYVWRDPIDDVTQSVTGPNSEEVLRKIQTIEHPVYQRLRDSLPPENPAGAPVFQAVPVGPSGANGRVLRPGSATYSLPERRNTSAPVVREDLISWERTASVAALKERYAKDRDFAVWYDSQNQVKQ